MIKIRGFQIEEKDINKNFEVSKATNGENVYTAENQIKFHKKTWRATARGIMYLLADEKGRTVGIEKIEIIKALKA